MLLHEIIENMQDRYEKGELNNEGALVFLDFEKAFDRVDHDFMFSVLKRMGYPPSFIKWVQLLYSDAQSQVRINNVASRPLKNKSGVKQG